MIEKKYKVKEIFYSLQGEGFYTGKPAIFVRFSGCNLWSGLEQDRLNATCKFCDTDFRGTDGENGGFYTREMLLKKLTEINSEQGACKFIIFTGGEPLLQLDFDLVKFLKDKDYYIAIETNGTCEAHENIDWITVSPKYGAILKQKSGNELKLVFPQQGFDPKEFEKFDFQYFFIQPKYDDNIDYNTKEAISFCMKNPTWRLSLQTHKILGVK